MPSIKPCISYDTANWIPEQIAQDHASVMLTAKEQGILNPYFSDIDIENTSLNQEDKNE